MNKSYYAVIPASVRYNKELTPNAKLLYGEITSLCNEKGYCWATNKYFCELYDVHKNTISKWISQLNELGFIKIQFTEKEDGSQQRLIYLNEIVDPPKQNDLPPSTETVNPPKQNNVAPINENAYHNTTVNNTGNNTFNARAPQNQNLTVYRKFEPPTVQEVEAFFIASGWSLQKAQLESKTYVLHYKSKNWKQGRTPITDWVPVAEMWVLRRNAEDAKKPKTVEEERAHQRQKMINAGAKVMDLIRAEEEERKRYGLE